MDLQAIGDGAMLDTPLAELQLAPAEPQVTEWAPEALKRQFKLASRSTRGQRLGADPPPPGGREPSDEPMPEAMQAAYRRSDRSSSSSSSLSRGSSFFLLGEK